MAANQWARYSIADRDQRAAHVSYSLHSGSAQAAIVSTREQRPMMMSIRAAITRQRKDCGHLRVGLIAPNYAWRILRRGNFINDWPVRTNGGEAIKFRSLA